MHRSFLQTKLYMFSHLAVYLNLVDSATGGVVYTNNIWNVLLISLYALIMQCAIL